MNEPIDAVVTHHLNPFTCGVAKFNLRLAHELRVPCYPLAAIPTTVQHPLISIKPEEQPAPLGRWHPHFDLFLHGLPSSVALLRWPIRVYAGNAAIASAVRPIRPDVLELWCPSTLNGRPADEDQQILSLGMAHKFQATWFERLRTLLERTGESYTLNVSTAVHEGSPWDTALEANAALMRGLFGNRVRMLGFLSDDALSDELRRADIVALCYEPAARANNTTLWAALEAGATVVTTLDAESPPELVHGRTVYDLAQLTMWPRDRLIVPPFPSRTWGSLSHILRSRIACPRVH